jgi:hypothetical protein
MNPVKLCDKNTKYYIKYYQKIFHDFLLDEYESINELIISGIDINEVKTEVRNDFETYLVCEYEHPLEKSQKERDVIYSLFWDKYEPSYFEMMFITTLSNCNKFRTF